MSHLPPPLPVFAPFKNDNTFARRASIACLASPVLVIVLAQAFGHAGKGLTGHTLAVTALTVSGVSCLVAGIGLILGMLGLAMMKSGGRTGIVVCSLAGMAGIGLLAAIAVPNFVRARSLALSQRETAAQIRMAFQDVREQSATALTNRGGPAANLDRIQNTLGEAAQKSSGQDAILMRGAQAFLRRTQTVQADYQRASEAVTSARVLATSNLVERAQIQEREAVVRKFLEANAALRNFVDAGQTNFRGELTSLHASDQSIEEALGGYEKSMAPQRPLITDIRAQDERIGQAMLAVLGLLDTNWGHWHYTTGKPHLVFDARAALDQYNLRLGEIREASLDQAASQRQLVAVIRQLPTP